MPPSKPLPPAILSALGLASSSCGIFGPCLDYNVCLDYVTYPTGMTGTTADTNSTPTGATAQTGDTGMVGPCLDYVVTGDTSDTGSAAPLPAPSVPDRDALLEELAAKGTLPSDVLEKLKGGFAAD